MLDAQPAANAPACPPAVQPIPASPANADTTGVRSKPAALLAAATALLPDLEAGRALDAKTLREAMSAALGAGDTHGAWVWRDAYEAAEAAMVLFIQRYGRLMHREAGAGPRDRPPPCSPCWTKTAVVTAISATFVLVPKPQELGPMIDRSATPKSRTIGWRAPLAFSYITFPYHQYRPAIGSEFAYIFSISFDSILQFGVPEIGIGCRS